MRSFLTFLLFLSGWAVFAQPNPDVFQTWYPKEVLPTDLDDLWVISQITPPISPTLTIYEDHSFEGVGACNTFQGIYEFPDPFSMGASSFDFTMDDCGLNILNWFESDYFPFVQFMGWYEIEEDGVGQVLTVGNPLMGYGIFTNYPLSQTEFKQSPLQIFPNPIQHTLHLKSEREAIRITCFSLMGAQLWDKNLSEGIAAVDISYLPSGIYILLWESETARGSLRIVKD